MYQGNVFTCFFFFKGVVYNIGFLLNKLLAINTEYVKIIVDSTVFTKNGRARK
jgi:hypothetical protein